MRARVTYPVLPVRWIHHRRGQSAATQHVVAYRTDGGGLASMGVATLTLCNKAIGPGGWYRAPEVGVGAKVRKPLVTFAPKADLPVCQDCARALIRARREGVPPS